MTFATVLCAGPALAQTDITYSVDQTVTSSSGTGTIVGQIVTDGALGILTKASIVSWSLTVTGGGVSTVLTSVGGQSGILLVGNDVIATARTLSFNYSGTDGGYLTFQASNPGFYSGQKYWCNNTTWYGCAHGSSAVPQSYNDSTAIYDMSYSGLQVIGTAGPPQPSQALLQSVAELSHARTAQMLVGQLQSELLLGLNEQVSCSNCGGAGATFGSAALSTHGRYALTKALTLFGGVDLGNYQQRGADVTLNVGFAAALQYDPPNMGASRPYAEVGVTGGYQTIRYKRSYANGPTMDTGVGSTAGRDISAFGEVGWVDRLTPRDEAAISLNISRQWQYIGGYTESGGDGNPLGATTSTGTDTLDNASLGVQFTHLFGRWIEANVNGGVNWTFGAHSGLRAVVSDIEVPGDQPAFVYYQVGGRIGVRVTKRLTIDMFVDGILAPSTVGSSAHGGFGARWSF